MNLLPRSFATMALAVAAVPGVAPLAAHIQPQHGRPAGLHQVTRHAPGRGAFGDNGGHGISGSGSDHGNVHGNSHAPGGHGESHPVQHAPGQPGGQLGVRPGGQPGGHPGGGLFGRGPGARAALVSAPLAGQVPGGWTEQNPGSPAVLDAARFAVGKLSQTFGGSYVVEGIGRAESQVVEGENFRIRMRIALLQDQILGARKDCTVVVWSRPWLKPADELTAFDCESMDTAGPAVAARGAVTEASVHGGVARV